MSRTVNESIVTKRMARMRKALRLERPDRMPTANDYRMIEYRKDLYHLGDVEDAVTAGEVVTSPDGHRRFTQDGGVWDVGDPARYRNHEDVLRANPASFEVEAVREVMLEEMRRLFGEASQTQFPMPLHYGTLVTRAVIEFGWEPFLEASAFDPEGLAKILDRFGEASVAVATGWAQVDGCEVVCIHDDIAGTRGVLMSPAWYKEYVFPWYARIFSAIRGRGKKVIYISDGNYEPVLDDILETEPDGLYVESTSMDLGRFMRRAGRDKIYLVKSDSRHIGIGSPQDIEKELLGIRALHREFCGMILYRGGGKPMKGNAEAYDRAFRKHLIYE